MKSYEPVQRVYQTIRHRRRSSVSILSLTFVQPKKEFNTSCIRESGILSDGLISIAVVPLSFLRCRMGKEIKNYNLSLYTGRIFIDEAMKMNTLQEASDREDDVLVLLSLKPS